MSIPIAPPLNGRNLAEFYVASEAAKRTTLREYARPPDQHQARIIMYDSIRRIVPQYFAGARKDDVLTSVEQFLANKHFSNPDFDETWHKSNRIALHNLRALTVVGELRDVHTKKTDIVAGKIRIISTVDFFATYAPKATNGKHKRVAVIVNPSGVKKAAEKRKAWITIESEVAARAAREHQIEIDDVWYIDLPKNEISKYGGPKKSVSNEIDATCERIFRDWRDIRLESSQGETGTA